MYQALANIVDGVKNIEAQRAPFWPFHEASAGFVNEISEIYAELISDESLNRIRMATIDNRLLELIKDDEAEYSHLGRGNTVDEIRFRHGGRSLSGWNH